MSENINEIRSLWDQVTELKHKLHDKDETIETQGNKIKELCVERDEGWDMLEELEEKENENKELKYKLAILQTEQVQRCRRDEKIKGLTVQLTQGQEAIAEFTSHIKELETQLDMYDTHNKPTNQWEREHKEKDNVNTELQRLLYVTEGQLTIKDKENKRLQHEVVDLKASSFVMAEKQKEIEKLQAKVTDQKHFLTLDGEELKEKTFIIEELQSEVELLRGILETKDNHIKELEDGQLEVVEIVEDKDNTIKELQEAFNTLAIIGEERDNKDNPNDFQDLDNHRLETKLRMTEASNRNLKYVIREKDNHIKVLREQVKELHIEVRDSILTTYNRNIR
jgi:chromosome segregation ATPase